MTRKTTVYLVTVEGSRGFGFFSEQKVYLRGNAAEARKNAQVKALERERRDHPYRKVAVTVALWTTDGSTGWTLCSRTEVGA